MKRMTIDLIRTGICLVIFLLAIACSKQEPEYLPVTPAVTLPRLENPGYGYWRISPDQRSVELDFGEAVDSLTVPGNITFSATGTANLAGRYSLSSFGRKVFILFPDFDTGTP